MVRHPRLSLRKKFASGGRFCPRISITKIEILGSLERSESNMATKKKLTKGKKATQVKSLLRIAGR
jgi:hypothetical protein